MNLDMRTVMLCYVVGSAICASMIVLIWRQHRQRWDGLGWCFANSLTQLVAIALIVLRGTVPDWVSIIIGNILIVSGVIMLYEGLARFMQQRIAQTHNVVLLAVFAVVHAYFTLVHPNLAAREINVSVGLLVICAQCAWLLLRQGQSGLSAAHWLGMLFVGHCLISVVRIILIISRPPGIDFFARSIALEVWVFIAYQALFIALTFGLVALVNHRLVWEMQLQGEALRLSEDKFAKAFHASPDAILITHPRDGRIVDVNEGFCRLSGYTREEAVDTSILTLELWADPGERAKFLEALQVQGFARDCEYDFIVKSGVRLTCLCFSEIIKLEGEAHILSVVRDITAARRAEAALRESETRLRAIGDNLPASQIYQLMLLPDGTQRFTYVSNGVEQLHECTATEAIADPTLLFNRVVEEDREGMRLATEKAICEMSVYDHEVRIRRKSGETRWHRHIFKPRQGSTGDFFFDGLEMDITEQHQAQEERERLIAELDAFSHTVAHDLKAPLTAVIGYADLLLADAKPSLAANHQKLLSRVMWAGRKMANIVDELLLMADMRGVAVEVHPIDMARVVAESLKRLAFMREEYQAQIHVPPDWPIVLGYQSWLEEVWVNYLSNAIKHGGRSPQVELGADVLPDRMVRFWVRDHGSGIADQDLGQLFMGAGPEPRVRAGGHGLGLSIVKRIVERLGGEVGVERADGHGSCFYFTLPLAEEVVPQTKTKRRRRVEARWAEEMLQ